MASKKYQGRPKPIIAAQAPAPIENNAPGFPLPEPEPTPTVEVAAKPLTTGCVSCGGAAIRREMTPADVYVVTMSNGAVMEVMSEQAARSVVGRYGGGYSVRSGT